MEPQFQAYLAWQEERGFLWPTRQQEQPQTSSDKNADMVVICSAEGQELSLLTKMLQAIGLADCQVSDDTVTGKVRLIFSPPPRGCRLGEPISTGSGTDFYTYHPKALIEVPELKKLAWSQLQTFKALIHRGEELQ